MRRKQWRLRISARENTHIRNAIQVQSNTHHCQIWCGLLRTPIRADSDPRGQRIKVFVCLGHVESMGVASDLCWRDMNVGWLIWLINLRITKEDNTHRNLGISYRRTIIIIIVIIIRAGCTAKRFVVLSFVIFEPPGVSLSTKLKRVEHISHRVHIALQRRRNY